MSDFKKVPPVALTLDVDQKESPFFRLPAELRIHIYELAVRDIELTWLRRKSGQVKKDPSGKEVWANEGRPQPPGLVMACKQLYEEAAPILYSSGKFVFHTMTMTRHWASCLRDENLKAVRDVTVRREIWGVSEPRTKHGICFRRNNIANYKFTAQMNEVEAELRRRAKVAKGANESLKTRAAVSK